MISPNFQPDAHLVDKDGRKHPVHSMLLRLKYPVFQNLQEFTSVTLDDVSSSAVRLIIDIAYGTDRFWHKPKLWSVTFPANLRI